MRLVIQTFLGAVVFVAAGCTKVHMTAPVNGPPPAGDGTDPPPVTPPATPPIVHPIDPGPPNFGPSGCTPPASASLMTRAEVIPQQSDLLCWAASAQVVARAFKVPYEQCQQVQTYPGYSCPFCLTCANSKHLEAGGCNHGGYPNFDNIGLTHQQTHEEAVSLEQIQMDIGCRKQPVVFTWQTGFASSHMMVVYGYTGDKLDIMQPLEPCEGDTFTIDYDTFKNTDVDGGKHLDDYYDFSLK